MELGSALAAYTRGGALAEGAGNLKGSIRKGMLADLVLVNTPLESGDVERVRDARSRLTVLGGEIVWEGDSG